RRPASYRWPRIRSAADIWTTGSSSAGSTHRWSRRGARRAAGTTHGGRMTAPTTMCAATAADVSAATAPPTAAATTAAASATAAATKRIFTETQSNCRQSYKQYEEFFHLITYFNSRVN